MEKRSKLQAAFQDLFPGGDAAVGLFNGLMLFLFAALLAITVGVGHYYSHVAVTAVVFPVGVAFGWVAGLLSSPYADEAKQFNGLARGISAFVSGYAISKVDTLFAETHQIAGFIPHVALCAAYFALTATAINVNRRYALAES